nr:MAG TPA: hypothetical protein [Caudoviricetes sp.]
MPNLLKSALYDPDSGRQVYDISDVKSGNMQQAAELHGQSPSPAIRMNYTDPTGKQAVGFSIDNKMYKDAAGTQRIDNGSIVSNAAGTQSWVMTPSGGVDYQQWLAQQQAQNNPQPAQQTNYLQQAQEAAQKAARQRMEATIQQIEYNRPLYNQQYDALARQNYQGYMSSKEQLANELASQGLYNSGYSDSAKVAQTTAYRERQNQNEQERLRRLAELDQQIAQARLNGDADLNDLEAEYAQLLQEQANKDRAFAYQKERDAIEDDQYNQKWQYQLDRDKVDDDRYNQKWNYNVDQDAKDRAWKERQFAYQKEQDAIANALKQAKLYASGSKSGGGLSGASAQYAAQLAETDPLTYEEIIGFANQVVQNAEKQGYSTAQVLNLLRDNEQLVTNLYGENGYALYRDSVLANLPGSSQYQAPEANYQYDYNDLSKTVEARLFTKNSYGEYTRDDSQKASVIGFISTLASSGAVSEADAEAVLKAYGLYDDFVDMVTAAEAKAGSEKSGNSTAAWRDIIRNRMKNTRN